MITPDNFNIFVIPFTLGMTFVIIWLLATIVRLWRHMPQADRRRVRHSILTVSTLRAAGEIVAEVLIHRRIWKRNKFLGYMHMSFAFGWFMLIVVGKFESLTYTGNHFNPIWYPLFFKFFVPGEHEFFLSAFFTQAMDLWLALILSGQILAFVKRRMPGRTIGIRPRHTAVNRAALTALWFIFPLRLAAESVTAGIHGGGGFLTGTIGQALAGAPVLDSLFMPLWWAYSISLGVFFVLIPFSRYFHIPVEGFLILARHWGVSDEATIRTLETLACSACGMCLRVCPRAQGDAPRMQPVYFIERLRAGRDNDNDVWGCLGCLRCEEVCPVVVHSTQIRMARKMQAVPQRRPQPAPAPVPQARQGVDVALFAGCMGKLTPGTKAAMNRILQAADLAYAWVDEDEDLCCGRPLRLSGRTGEAQARMDRLKTALLALNPRVIVSTCPICYNMIRAAISARPVLHHTDFVAQLIDEGRIAVGRSAQTLTYHDPCELSRMADISSRPVSTLAKVGTLKQPDECGRESHCCGGALGGLAVAGHERTRLMTATADYLQRPGAQTIVTACPLCKKSIAQHAATPVVDFAEAIAKSLKTSSIDQ